MATAATQSRPYLPRSAAGPYSPWLIAVIVSIATFMEVLDTTITNVALRHISGSLGAGQDEATWIVTSYLVSNAIVLPISGWLSNVLGRKRFYMICVILFTISSLMCSLATSLTFMVVWRVIQGIGGGGLAPAEQSMLADTFPPNQRAKVFALYGFTVLVAPAIGPVVGGWLTDNLSWHWVFLINIPFGILSLMLTWIFVDEPDVLVQERRALLKKGFNIDYVGFAMVAIGFGSLQILLDQFEREDGFNSGFIAGLAVISLVCLTFLMVWEWDHPHPAVDIRLMRFKNFAISAGVMFVIGFMLMSSTQLLPQLSQSLLGYDATTAGLSLGIGGMMTAGLMPFAAIATQKFRPGVILAGAMIALGIAMLRVTTLSLSMDFWNVAWARSYQVFALPFLFIPISAASYVGLPPNKSSEAAAISNLMRNLGGSIGVAFASIWLQYRSQFHTARLAEGITSSSDLHGQSLAQVARSVQTQASFMAYTDVYYMLALIALCIWPLTLFLKTPPKGTQIGH